MAEVEFTWALDGYCARYGFLAQPEGLTMREAARVFQLDPQPPEAGTLNDYITAACGSETWTTSPSSCTTMKPGSMAVFAVS